jgi:hypothetical protein
MHDESTIRAKIKQFRRNASQVALAIFLAFVISGMPVPEVLAARSPQPQVAPQRTFGSPDEAAKALVNAARSEDPQELLAILGSDAKTLISSGDPVQDRSDRERFAKAASERSRIETDPVNANKVFLVVGSDDWPFPIPLEKVGDHWLFATREGKQEILARRIGRNELNAIEICRDYVIAQQEYAFRDRNANGVREYAQQFLSTPGGHDGLYWNASGSDQPSPIGAPVANAAAEGYTRSNTGPQPYHGYIYKILKAQGPAAPGGVRDYVIKGLMIGGFALVAYPAMYGSSGIKTFLVNQRGVVYEKDLGPTTAQSATAMTRFNPDNTWKQAP